jgi:hypothetical protein
MTLTNLNLQLKHAFCSSSCPQVAKVLHSSVARTSNKRGSRCWHIAIRFEMAVQADEATIAKLGGFLADPALSLAKRYRILFTLRNIPSDASVLALAKGVGILIEHTKRLTPRTRVWRHVCSPQT